MNVDRDRNALLRISDELVSVEEFNDIVSGFAFNCGYSSTDELLNPRSTKRPPRNGPSIKKLEKKIEKQGGDKAWLIYHH
jgi:hypothetical protein